jgi:Tfp pilus assembly protein PilF
MDSKRGAPFNDIGNYLIQKNELENAIPWLEEAKLKPNYECRHFPYINLGRIYATMERYDDAIDEFEQALEYATDHDALENVIAHLQVLRKK